MKNFSKLMLGLAFVLMLNGCTGYRLGNVQGESMKGVKTIYVPVVKNQSYEPGISAMVTNAILRRISNDGTFQIARKKPADAVLEVEITEIQKDPLRNSRSDVLVAVEYGVTIIAKAKLTNLKTGQKVFDGRVVKGSSKFFVQGDVQEGERQTLPQAAEELATNLVSLVSEGW